MGVVRKKNVLMHYKSSVKLHGEGNIFMCFSRLSMFISRTNDGKDLEITKKRMFAGLLAERSHLEVP